VSTRPLTPQIAIHECRFAAFFQSLSHNFFALNHLRAIHEAHFLWPLDCTFHWRSIAKNANKIKEVLNMKIQNIIRRNAVAIGFAAALFFATTPVRSQEITNTEFSGGPYVTAYAQPATDVQQATAPVTQATTTQAPAAVVSTPVVSNTQLSSMVTTAGDWMLISALSGLALIGLYAIAEIRRANRSTRPRPPLTRSIALS
jgi:hypothetical protein